MNVQTRTVGIDTVSADLVLLPLAEGMVPLEGGAGLVDWRLEGRLSRLLREKRCRGRLGERVLLLNAVKLGSGSVWVEGVGALERSAPDDLARLLWRALQAARKAGAAQVAVAADLLVGVDRAFPTLAALAQALERAAGGSESNRAPAGVTLTLLNQNLF